MPQRSIEPATAWLAECAGISAAAAVQLVNYLAAAQALDRALDICRDLGDRFGQAGTLNYRGTLHLFSGEHERAERCHQQALELARAIANSWNEAHALAGLGRCALAAGDAAQAEARLREALEIFQRIGAAEAPDLLKELNALTESRNH